MIIRDAGEGVKGRGKGVGVGEGGEGGKEV